MRFHFLLSLAFGLALLYSSPTSGQDAKDGRKKDEYYKRLAEVPPRSAQAYVELAEWCRSEGLEEEAIKAFGKAVEIDSDCEKARLALGFQRYGTGWRKPGTKGKRAPLGKSAAGPGPQEEPGAVAKPPAEGQSPAAPAPTLPAVSPPPAAAAPVAPAAGAGGEPEKGAGPAKSTEGPATGVEEAKPEAAQLKEIERKKAWAAEAQTKIAATFYTYEDRDFLIHTTLSKTSRELATLRSDLLSLKRLLVAIIGAKSAARVWPSKLQFILLKSEPEYERFAQMVDAEAGVKNPEGAYTKDGHTVLWRPDSELLPEILGETALEEFDGSDRWIGWWLKDGVAELLLSQSPEGLKKDLMKKAFIYAGDILTAEGDRFKVFNLLETRDYKSADETRNRALALTLIDYLLKKSRSGFHGLIRALKSEKAPAPAKSNADFDSFYQSYVSFQAQSMASLFSMPLDTLDQRWKEYVLQAAQKYKEQEAKEKDDEKEKGKAGGKKKQ